MPIVSSKGMFVNSDWMSRDAIKQGRGEKGGGAKYFFPRKIGEHNIFTCA